MNQSIFKAYDIRGRYPEEINEEAVAEIAGALAGYFSKVRDSRSSNTIVVGHDARLSSPALLEAVLDGLKIPALKGDARQGRQDSKLKILNVGMITTPMLYFLVNHFKAVGGIMVTASHNPKEFNGLKVVGEKAAPMSGLEIKKLVIGR